MRRSRRLLVLVLPFTYLTFFAGNTYSARFLGLRVAFHLLPLLLLGTWLVVLIKSGRGIPKTALDRPLLAWLGVALAASLTGLSPRLSLERVWLWYSYVLALYLFVDLHYRGWHPAPLESLYLTAAVVCLVGVYEWCSWYLGTSYLPGASWSWPALGGWQDPLPPVFRRLNATLGGATALSAYLAVLIPPAIGWLLTTERRQARWALSTWLAVALVVQVLTFSRGGILALGVSLPVAAAGWLFVSPHLWHRAKERLLAQHEPKHWALIITLVLTVIAAGGFWAWHSFAAQRGWGPRFTRWQAALDALRGHPWLGVGPANYGRALLQQNDNSLPRRRIQTAHNAYLNVAAETGFLGLLAGGWLLLSVARAWMARWRDATKTHRLRLTACGAALIGLAAQLLVDTIVAPANWLPVLAITAFALAPQRARRSTRASRNSSGWAVAALSGLVLVTSWLTWKDVAQSHFDHSVQATRESNFERAAQEIDQARIMDRGFSLYAFQSAHIHGLWSTTEGDTLVAQQAISDYEAGLAIDPVWGKQTANMASLLWELGDRAEAINWMERTVTAVPEPVYLMNLGRFQELEGMEEDAWQRYAEALHGAPSWAGSGFWTATAERAEAWPEILRRAEGLVADVDDDQEEVLAAFQMEVAWARGDLLKMEEVARSEIQRDSHSPRGYAWLARSLLEQGRVEAALSAAERAAQLAPNQSPSLAVRGCVRGQTGDRVNATRDLQKALFISPNAQQAHACLGHIHEETGELDAAIEAYIRAVGQRAISQDVEMTLYHRLATFDTLPGLVRIRMGENEADPWLRAARLYEQTNRCEEAQTVYRALLAEDHFLEVARERLRSLPCYGGDGT